jgi:hypothetical protein
MYELLESEDASIISWSGEGKAFRIHNPALFSSTILPKYFRHSKLTSLQRQLNLYGFTHVTKGPIAGSYLHQLFQRGHPETLDLIKRANRKPTNSGPGHMGYNMGWNLPMGPPMIYGMGQPFQSPQQGQQNGHPQQQQQGQHQQQQTQQAGPNGTPPAASNGANGNFPAYPGYGYMPPPIPGQDMNMAMAAWSQQQQQQFPYPMVGFPQREDERAAKRGRSSPDTLEKVFLSKPDLDTETFEPLAVKLVESMGAAPALAMALAMIAGPVEKESEQDSLNANNNQQDMLVNSVDGVQPVQPHQGLSVEA